MPAVALSVAALEEVIADPDHLIPASRIRFSAAGFNYHASTVLGLSPGSGGVNMETGLDKDGNAVPLDTGKQYADKINAVLAKATPTTPVFLTIDIGVPIGKGIAILPTGDVDIEGQGDDTGFYCLPGANCNAIQNFPLTDYACRYVWTGASGYATDSTHVYTGVMGKNIRIANLMINGNRGTYPNGNSSGTRDGTLPDFASSVADARSSYAGPTGQGAYWLSGIILAHVRGFVIDRVKVYNSPAYAVNLYDCQHGWIDRGHIDVADPTVLGNQDGYHLNGGCQHIFINGCYIRSGDDPIAGNFREGNGAAGDFITVNNIHIDGCLTGGRFYGSCGRLYIRDIRGTCELRGILIGDEGLTASGSGQYFGEIDIRDLAFNVTYGGYTDPSMVSICADCGVVSIDGARMKSSTIACPVVQVGINGTGPTIDTLRATRAHVHRDETANAAGYLFRMDSGTVGDLGFERFRLTEQVGHTYADVGSLLHLIGGTVNNLDLDGVANGAGSLLTVDSGATMGPVQVRHVRHVSHGGGATGVVNNSATNIHLNVGTYLQTGVSALSGGSGTVTPSGAATVAI